MFTHRRSRDLPATLHPNNTWGLRKLDMNGQVAATCAEQVCGHRSDVRRMDGGGISMSRLRELRTDVVYGRGRVMAGTNKREPVSNARLAGT